MGRKLCFCYSTYRKLKKKILKCHKVLHNYAIFLKYFYFARFPKYEGLIKTQKYSCQLCNIQAIGCQNLIDLIKNCPRSFQLLIKDKMVKNKDFSCFKALHMGYLSW